MLCGKNWYIILKLKLILMLMLDWYLRTSLIIIMMLDNATWID